MDWKHLWNHEVIFLPQKSLIITSQMISSCVQEENGAMDNVVAFIDGTVIDIARPEGDEINRRLFYNVHKRKHLLKFQTIKTPDGLCVHLFGSEVRRRNEMYLYDTSGENGMLQEVLEIK